MKKHTLFFVSILIASLSVGHWQEEAQAAWIWSPDIGKWINPKKTAKDTPEEQYEWAMQFYKNQNWDRSVEEFEKIPAVFPNSRLAAEGVYYTGLSYEAKNDLAKAADNYQKLIDRYPYSDRIKDAIKHEFEIANLFASGEKIKLAGLPLLGGQEKAIELYKHIVKNAPFGSYGDQAQFKIAELHKSVADYEEAQKAYQALIDDYPTSDLVAQAKYQIAYVAMLASKQSQYDDLYAQRAIDQFKEFKEQNPETPQALEADESIKVLRAKKALTHYEVAAFYDKQKKMASAKVYYQEVITRYPETQAAERARQRLEQLVKPENESPKKKGGFPFKLW